MCAGCLTEQWNKELTFIGSQKQVVLTNKAFTQNEGSVEMLDELMLSTVHLTMSIHEAYLNNHSD